MAKVNNIKGVAKLLPKLKKLEMEVKAQNGATVVVGFTQSYALYVHENLEAYHRVGSAKFLEGAANQLQSTLRRIIDSVVLQTNDLRKALLTAGLRLQREAQKLTPVDTGALKASAFTDFQENIEGVAQRAFERSEKIRQRKRKKRKR